MIIKKYLKEEYNGCEVEQCNENNCKLKFNRIRDHMILKGELISKGKFKICDYFIFINDSTCIICMVELRSNNVDASDIIKKFENAERQIKSFLKSYKLEGNKFKYYPILLSKSIARFDNEVITCKKICGEKIIREDCGIQLQHIFKNY